MSAENEAVVRRYLTEAFAAVRDGDLRATPDFLTGDALFHDPGPATLGWT
jgi:hypothetical protein